MKRTQTPSTVVVPAERRCPRCGMTMDGFGPEGLCGVCMFDAALAADEAPSAPPDPFASSARRFGDYELMQEIARGGMGVVFKARQVSLNRIVAVKMILRGEFASVAELARFRAEAETAARLHHPNVVAIHEVGEHEGQPFFSMDYVEGQNLAQLVGNTPLPAVRAAKYLKTIAEAVQHAHQHGVLHRDLKPSNVLIDLATDTPRVTDFGLAKRLSNPELETLNPELTLTGQVLGSPNFMPPEQAAGRNDTMGPASDVYSLGALLYHSLTGRPPFVGESVTATLRLVAESEAVPPRLLNDRVPRDLETICLKCLQKEPSRRYASAQELAEELGRFQRDEPIQARPVALGEKFMRWCRRHPALTGVSVLALLLLLTVAIVSTTFAIRLDQSNKVAQEQLRNSYVAQARANRWSGRPGRRFDSLDALQKAAAIRPSIELRNEAIASMALVDMRSVKTWDLVEFHWRVIDPRFERYVRIDNRTNVSVHRLADDSLILRLPAFDAHVTDCWFSPNSALLAVRFANFESGPNLKIFDLGRRQLVLAPTSSVYTMCFSPDGRKLAIHQFDQSKIQPRLILDVESGSRLSSFPSAFAQCNLEFDPTGTKLASINGTNQALEIHDAATGRLIQSFEPRAQVNAIEWHPHDDVVALACYDGRTQLLDAHTGRSKGTLVGHQSPVVRVAYHPHGDLLLSTSWDGTLRLWDALSGKQLLLKRVDGTRGGAFSQDGNWAMAYPDRHKLEMMEVALPREWRQLHFQDTRGKGTGSCGFSSDGRWLVSCHEEGMRIWDVAKAKECAFLPLGKTRFAGFHPNGDSLITVSDRRGIEVWPMLLHMPASNDDTGVQLAVPFRFESPGLIDAPVLDRLGQTLVGQRNGTVRIVSLLERRQVRQLEGPVHIYRATLDPTGKWCAGWASSVDDNRAYVWDVAAARLVQTLEMPGAFSGAFSADGRWLFTGSTEEWWCWQTGSWQRRYSNRRNASGESQPAFAFSADGFVGAVTVSQTDVRLFVPATGQELATLEAPDEQIVYGLAFSPDGSQLAVANHGSSIHLWDVRAIRGRLAAMKLDWDSPPLPLSTAGPSVRLDVSQVANQFVLPITERIPSRDTRCGPNLIDLTGFYNVALTNNWIDLDHPNQPRNDLSNLPSGRQTFGGIDFDVRGFIQLQGADPSLGYPTGVSGIPIGQRGRALHFLHSSIWLPSGTNLVGEYTIHYADGQQASVPLVLGENISNLWVRKGDAPSHTKPHTRIAWRGVNPRANSQGYDICLLQFRWENPRPAVEIASIDFESDLTVVAPFLVAITVE